LRAVENQAKQLKKLQQQQTPPPKVSPPQPATEQPSKSETSVPSKPAPAAKSVRKTPAKISRKPAAAAKTSHTVPAAVSKAREPIAKEKGKAAVPIRSQAVLPKNKPLQLHNSQNAPALPAPVEVGTLPEPRGAAKPEASADVPHQ
jgi:hypothetical protein